MRIFLSWSGVHSHQVALALERLLRGVIQTSDPWVSSNEIRPGERWSAAISGELQKCNFGIICLTPSNQNSPWLNFEAGAISKNIEQSNVVPFLHGLTIPNMSGGPLSQFQAKESTFEGVSELLKSINILSPQPLREPVLADAIEVYWPRFISALEAIEMTPQDEALSQRSTDEKLDEIIKSLRNRNDDDIILNKLLNNSNRILRSLQERDGIIASRDPLALMKLSSLQMRAFLKPATLSVDDHRKIVRIGFSEKNAFFYKQVLFKQQELELTVKSVFGSDYELRLDGPAETYRQYMESFPVNPDLEEEEEEDILS